MIVLDASAALDYLLAREPHFGWVSSEIAGTDGLHAPHLVDYEILSALRRLLAGAEIDERRARVAFGAFVELDLTRYPHTALLERVWALRANVTVADAFYVALAEALAAPLLTTDRALARTPRLRIEVRTPPE